MSQPRSKVDWEAVLRDYRAGILSLREIASMYGISPALICKKAKQHPDVWKRDLTQRVRQAIRRRIVDDDVIAVDDDTVIEQAADRALEIIRRHRRSLAITAEVEQRIFNELNGAKKLSISAKASALNALVSAQEKRIRMERQAFGITDDIGQGEGIREVRLIFDGDD